MCQSYYSQMFWPRSAGHRSEADAQEKRGKRKDGNSRARHDSRRYSKDVNAISGLAVPSAVDNPTHARPKGSQHSANLYRHVHSREKLTLDPFYKLTSRA